MKIYALIHQYDYEGDYLIGVYSNLSNAIKALKPHIKKSDYKKSKPHSNILVCYRDSYSSVRIEERELDTCA